MERKESSGNGMGPVYVFFVLWTLLLVLIGGLEVRAGELRPGTGARWIETMPPASLTDRCRSVRLEKKGLYKVEIQSPALSSGLWIESDGVEARVLTRSVGVLFRVCRPGYVLVCDTSPYALGAVHLTVDEEPDPLEVMVDEDPFRIDLCDPSAPFLETPIDIVS